MFKLRLILGIAIASFLISCSNEDSYEKTSDEPIKSGTEIINKTAQADGVSYKLSNVAINPNLVAITPENAKVESSDNDLESGAFKLSAVSAELKKNLVSGNILYIKNDNTVFLRKIQTAKETANGLFELTTTAANLGDLFEGGSLELTVNVEEAENAKKLKSAKAGIDQVATFDIFKNLKEYKADALTFSPNSSVKALVNLKVGFGASKLLPNEVVFSYELQTTVNPYMAYANSVNKTYQFDVVKNVPQNLTNLIKGVEVSVDLPLGSLGTIPAKVKIEQINLPVEIEANIAKECYVQQNVTGSFKIGYAYYNNVPGKKSQFIYENSMVVSKNPVMNLSGEVLSNMKIVIIPKISLVDLSLFNVSGQISFGLETQTSGIIDVATKTSKLASKGTFVTKGTFDVKSLGVNILTTDIINQSKDLWNIGQFDKTMAFSNLRISKPSKTVCTLRSYSYSMILDYKYPILGKKIAGDLEITYDVYDDSKKLLAGGQRKTFRPGSLTANSFTFDLCIPFKVDLLAFTSGLVKKTSYIKNIKITDKNGNIGSIINPSTGKPYDEIMIASPYNTTVWK